ncbi:hypothetical protein DFH09DRAFT_197412 [Mycena vulgaris]|nr:hypothetical protein DFH09DRAFT_197412 [Mycena vulgaris]
MVVCNQKRLQAYQPLPILLWSSVSANNCNGRTTSPSRRLPPRDLPASIPPPYFAAGILGRQSASASSTTHCLDSPLQILLFHTQVSTSGYHESIVDHASPSPVPAAPKVIAAEVSRPLRTPRYIGQLVGLVHRPILCSLRVSAVVAGSCSFWRFDHVWVWVAARHRHRLPSSFKLPISDSDGPVKFWRHGSRQRRQSSGSSECQR